MNKLDFLFYKYKGKVYRVMGLAEMKCPVTGKWFQAVRYEPERDSSKTYIRSIPDFIAKFEGVEL